MSEAIITFFVCLIVYRGVCAYLNWSPAPIVQVVLNSYYRRQDADE